MHDNFLQRNKPVRFLRSRSVDLTVEGNISLGVAQGQESTVETRRAEGRARREMYSPKGSFAELPQQDIIPDARATLKTRLRPLMRKGEGDGVSAARGSGIHGRVS